MQMPPFLGEAALSAAALHSEVASDVACRRPRLTCSQPLFELTCVYCCTIMLEMVHLMIACTGPAVLLLLTYRIEGLVEIKLYV